MQVIWLFLFSFFLVIEAATFNLITVWFALGALGSFISSYFINNVLIQLLIFVIVTGLSLLATRPLVKKILKKVERTRTNLDAVINSIGIVSETIKPDTIGRVDVMGKNWAAKGYEHIRKGSKVKVLAIEGAKLIVEKESVKK